MEENIVDNDTTLPTLGHNTMPTQVPENAIAPTPTLCAERPYCLPPNKVQEASSFLEVFQCTLDAVDAEHPEAIKPSILKKLYDLSLYFASFEGPNYFDIRSLKFGPNEEFNGFHNLCNFLFGELSNRFERLYSALFFVPEDFETQKCAMNSDMWAPQPEFTLLLRCCILMLFLLEFDQRVLLEKCEILLSILSKLCSPELTFHISRYMTEVRERIIKFRKFVSCECTYAGDGHIISITEKSDAFISSAKLPVSPMPLFCSILEVFMDELLVHRLLRKYFVKIDAISCSKEKLFNCQLGYDEGNTNALMELFAAHFLLLNTDQLAFTRFLNRLPEWHGNEYPIKEVWIVAGLSFFGHPVIFSAPQIFQAYSISLVSRTITDAIPSDFEKLDCKYVNCYLSAFEIAFNMYARNMCSLQLEESPFRTKCGSSFCHKPCMTQRSCRSSYESFIRPVTCDNIKRQVAKFSANTHSQSSKTKSEILSSCAADMKWNQFILYKSHKDEFLLILNRIISQTVSGEIEGLVLQRSGDLSSQHMYLLASIIKLMGNSLLITIWCLQRGNSGCLKTSKNCFPSREYNLIKNIISSFQEITCNQSTKEPVHEMRRIIYQADHKESNKLLLHFACLLRFSFRCGYECLWNACVLMIMTLMNLVILEEGNLDAVKSIFGLKTKPLPSQSSEEHLQVLVARNSSLAIASKFKKAQMLNLRNQRENLQKVLQLKNMEETLPSTEEESTCNGESFIDLLQGGKRPPDFDHLADFVVCKQGKDYSCWLKEREQFRKWKHVRRTSDRKKRSAFRGRENK